ncbi:MAG: hypothetical protein P8183_18450 [Anaerolineae bacterium]
MSDLQLSQLIDEQSPDAVWEEVKAVLSAYLSEEDWLPLAAAFTNVVDLYEGRYDGYRACNTPYHDLRHITDVFLALARLIHGSLLDGFALDGRSIALALSAALFHDSGLIQSSDDTDGTGAKYLADHDQRSLRLMRVYGRKSGWSESEIEAGCFLISCTDLSRAVAEIAYPSATFEHLGKLLAAADLIAQMADRVYLEKLLYLYHEFKEGGIGNYTGEVDLLRKTIGFYQLVDQRLSAIAEMIDRLARRHFAARWSMDVNLYQAAIDNQKEYLHFILDQPGDPRTHLRRQDIVQKVHQTYGNSESPLPNS